MLQGTDDLFNREICAPSNCEFKQAEKVCHEEEQDSVQNIPTEDCNLEPQEDCRMETVLVPRYILATTGNCNIIGVTVHRLMFRQN